jgi:hypothetical protein
MGLYGRKVYPRPDRQGYSSGRDAKNEARVAVSFAPFAYSPSIMSRIGDIHGGDLIEME